ncbi:hypothetical protein EV702DRAFT_1107795 [Suillus placidus]|uniref:Uncharacterized protein n=1 Tax=Suillus placidus TaxID=48579 RepID=A0A9P6ZU91_9AGAM|nr:hypothetical protein EV702DRAFT_1107795 [Suillus placidus]
MLVILNDAVLEELGETAVSSASSIVEERFPESQDESQSMPSKPPASAVYVTTASSISTNTSSVKPRAGVGIPSQRRWLLYLSQLLVDQGPPGMKVLITQISLRLCELFGIKASLVRAASLLINGSRKGRKEPPLAYAALYYVWIFAVSLLQFITGISIGGHLHMWQNSSRSSGIRVH